MGGRYIEVFAHSAPHTPPRGADPRSPGSDAPLSEPPATRSARALASAEASVGTARASGGFYQPARPRAKSMQLGGGAPAAAGAAEPADEYVVKMRGLPFKACARDVVGFFGGAGGAQLAESAVHFGLNAHGRPTGEASVRFSSAEVRARARCGGARGCAPRRPAGCRRPGSELDSASALGRSRLRLRARLASPPPALPARRPCSTRWAST